MLPIIISFVPTPDDWRESLRVLRSDIMVRRMMMCIVLLLLALLLTIIAYLAGWNLEFDERSGWIFLLPLTAFAMFRRPLMRALRRIRRPPPRMPTHFTGERRYKITEQLVRYRHETSPTFHDIPWTSYCAFTETPTCFFLFSPAFGLFLIPARVRRRIPVSLLIAGPETGITPLPKRAFACEPDVNAFRDLARSKLPLS